MSNPSSKKMTVYKVVYDLIDDFDQSVVKAEATDDRLILAPSFDEALATAREIADSIRPVSAVYRALRVREVSVLHDSVVLCSYLNKLDVDACMEQHG